MKPMHIFLWAILIIASFLIGYLLKPESANTTEELTNLQNQVNDLQQQNSQLQNQVNDLTKYQGCLFEELNNTPENYVKGTIVVEFNQGATTVQKDELVSNLGLETLSKGTFGYTIKVPKNEELKWICNFQENSIVKDALFNGIAYVS